MDLQTVIFIGPQGSGKGTQAELLETYLANNTPYKVFHYKSGDRFRELAERDTYTSQIVRDSVVKGKVQPLLFAVTLLGNEFIEHLGPDMHILMDGIPRTVSQAEMLDAAIDFYNRENRSVISLTLPDDIATERMLKRGRADDTEESIRERLDWYHAKTRPVIDFYKNHTDYTYHEVSAEPDVDTIHQNILKELSLS